MHVEVAYFRKTPPAGFINWPNIVCAFSAARDGASELFSSILHVGKGWIGLQAFYKCGALCVWEGGATKYATKYAIKALALNSVHSVTQPQRQKM